MGKKTGAPGRSWASLLGDCGVSQHYGHLASSINGTIIWCHGPEKMKYDLVASTLQSIPAVQEEEQLSTLPQRVIITGNMAGFLPDT